MRDYKKCWAQAICKGYPNACGDFCVGYTQLRTLYELSEMPERYQDEIVLTSPDRDKEAFLYLQSYREQVVERIEKGEGLYIYSLNKGNAKTTWATKIMRRYFERIALTNAMRCRGLYISVPSFLQDIRNSFGDGSATQKLERRVDSIRTADLVIWDDIGAEVPSKWVREQLYSFINGRYAEEKAQIFTSNLSLDKLADDEIMGERIASRIAGSCAVIQFVNQDRRAGI